MALESGTRLGDYEIVKPLGRGGMGDVYLGQDTSLDRPVAIKTILTPDPNDEEMLKRFRQEAQSAAKLIHPNIVQVYRVDLESNPPYMAMEYVDGRTLEQLIKSDGALSWQRALTVCGQVVSALAMAHEQGIVHRDIKPANIMVDAKGRVRVTDFGLAKVMDSSLQMTRDNQSIGSPYYMSPEHWGEGDVGPSSDLFSLGITIFELIAGRLPFEAKSAPEMMMKITTKPLPPLAAYAPGTPRAIQQFVETLAARELQKRYQSANQVLDDLQSIKNKQVPVHMQRLGQVSVNPVTADDLSDSLGQLQASPSSAFRAPIRQEPDGIPTSIKAAIVACVVVVVGGGSLLLAGGSSTPVEESPMIEATPVSAETPTPTGLAAPVDGPPEPAGDRAQGFDPLQQSPNLPGERPWGGDRNNVRPPQLGVDFNVAADGQLVDARTGTPLLSHQHMGHNVPAVRRPDGGISPAGRTSDGQWVPLPPPPGGPRR